MSCSDRNITAIDQNGQIWILCGKQNHTGELNLPHVTKNNEYFDRTIQRPIQTNWMSKRGLKAL